MANVNSSTRHPRSEGASPTRSGRNSWVLILLGIFVLVADAANTALLLAGEFAPTIEPTPLELGLRIFFAVAALLMIVFGGLGMVRSRETSRERVIRGLVSGEVAARVGAAPAAELASPDRTLLSNLSPTARAVVEKEVASQVEEAVRLLEERMRAVEERFPSSADFQKFADANQLFIAYQMGELGKRLDRLEEKTLSRTQVAATVLATVATLVGATAGVLAILRAVGVIR